MIIWIHISHQEISQEAETLSNCILQQMAQKQNGYPIVFEKEMANPYNGTDLAIIDSQIITQEDIYT